VAPFRHARTGQTIVGDFVNPANGVLRVTRDARGNGNDTIWRRAR
jgi:hypothetical protein